MNIFGKTNSYWVKYGKYVISEHKGERFVHPAPNAKPKVYNPLDNAENMIISALNVGMLAMKNSDKSELEQAVLDFVHEYGLLGFITEFQGSHSRP